MSKYMKKYALVDKKGGVRVRVPLGSNINFPSLSPNLPTLDGLPMIPGYKVNNISLAQPKFSLPFNPLNPFMPGPVVVRSVTTSNTTRTTSSDESWYMEGDVLYQKTKKNPFPQKFKKVFILMETDPKSNNYYKIEGKIEENDLDGSNTLHNTANRLLKSKGLKTLSQRVEYAMFNGERHYIIPYDSTNYMKLGVLTDFKNLPPK
jgi:hypothetical protein